MSGSLLGALIWLLLANVMAMIPSHDNHWQRAYFLMAVGVPLVIWIVMQNGWIFGLMFIAAGASVLRWPVIYLVQWMRGKRDV